MYLHWYESMILYLELGVALRAARQEPTQSRNLDLILQDRLAQSLILPMLAFNVLLAAVYHPV
jgi:hypothetical protein